MTTNMPSNSQSGKSAPPRGEHSTRVRADDGQEREEAREAGQTDKRPSPPWLALFPLSPFSCRIWILVRRLRPPGAAEGDDIIFRGCSGSNRKYRPDPGRTKEGGRDGETESARPGPTLNGGVLLPTLVSPFLRTFHFREYNKTAI